jgi:exodeoxyribonuclease V gamma subunit
MTKQLQTFFSNRIEHLYIRLKGELFGQPSTPFARRLIVVPSPAMKSWLMLQMARDPDLGIAAAIEVSYLDQTIKHLCKLLNLSPSNPQQETLLHVELALALEIEIRQIIQCLPEMLPKEAVLWQPMLHYLKIPASTTPLKAPLSLLTRKTERRLTTLCEKLAALFAKYGIYGGQMVTEWENSSDAQWQKKLWCLLFKQIDSSTHNPRWNYPYREISALLQHPLPLLQEQDVGVHLFCMSFLPKLQHTFLTYISDIIPINYYLHSPCQAFWSDIKSDRESQWLQSYWKKQGVSQSQQQELEIYLQDRNPLLANFGKLGREMARQIEESEITQSFDDYELTRSVAAYPQYEQLLEDNLNLREAQIPLTLLEAVQADMILLRTPDPNKKIPIESDSNSIQVHAAHSRMREVQILYNTLIGIISKHSRDPTPIYPGEIIVMAPDISLYTPHIKAVFGCDESILKTQIMDIAIPSHSPYVQAFLHLLSLPFSRWDATALLQLFDYPVFQMRHELNREEVNTIREWVRITGVRWGADSNHRNELLKRDHCRQGMVENSPIGTWEHAIERLLSDLIQNPKTESLRSVLDNIDSTQSQLLGKWIFLLRSLREDLSCLIDGTALSLSEWAKYLQCLAESYFSVDDSQSNEDYEILMTHIDAFKVASQKLGAHPLPFSTIRHHLNAALQKQREHYREHDLNAVHFCSMLPMRTIPAQVIVMLGMEEGAFPRQQPNLSLNLLQDQKNVDYCPSQIDYDRYLFLEALLSTRRYLLITYQGFSASDGKEQPPSLLVTELLAYLDKAYTLGDYPPSKYCLRIHPLHPFDCIYFSPNEHNLQSFSKTHYLAAQAFYQAEKAPSECFLNNFSVSEDTTSLTVSGKTIHLELKDLVACARNPIKAYFNRTLGIYLDNEEDRTKKNEELFHLSSLQSYFLKKEALKVPLHQIIQQAEQEGLLPIGAFKNVAVDKIHTDIAVLHQNLSGLGVDTQNIFKITFSEQYLKPKQSEDGDWHLPPLEFPFKEIKVKITGTLKEVSPLGLIAHIKDDKAEIVKTWPEFLLLSILSKQHSLPIQNNLLLVKGSKGKVKEAFFDDPSPHLERYLDYYFTTLKHVSPLIPEWVPYLMQEGASFDAKMRDSLLNKFNRNYNDYLLWALQGKILPNSEMLRSHWQPRAKSLFSDLYGFWYSKSSER